MNKITLTLIFICGLCLIGKAQLNGLYVRTGTEGAMVSEAICFNETRFNYSWSSDLATLSCKGNYEVNNDTLILNSDVKLKDLIQVKQHSLENLDSLYISILTVSQVAPYKTTLTINDSIQLEITDKRGQLITYPKNLIKKLSIKSSFVDWRISRIDFQIDGSTTLIEIVLNDTHGIWNAFFDNEKYIIEKNRLINENEEDYFFIHSPNSKCK